MLKTMTRDFLNFAKTNPLYLLCSAIYFHIPILFYGLILGREIDYLLSLIVAIILYAISLAIIFSPAGESCCGF